MEQPLMIQILEAEIRSMEKDLRGLAPIPRLEDSEYLLQMPVYSGPDYLRVDAKVWGYPRLSVEGLEVCNAEEARQIAHELGFKGIKVLFAGEER